MLYICPKCKTNSSEVFHPNCDVSVWFNKFDDFHLLKSYYASIYSTGVIFIKSQIFYYDYYYNKNQFITDYNEAYNILNTYINNLIFL